MPIYGPAQVFAVRSADEYVRRQVAALQKRSLRAWVYEGPAQVVRIEAARALFDCPNCRGGVSASHEWRMALCLACGARFDEATLTFPDEWLAIEAVLDARPKANRNWLPSLGETLESLQAENVKHGLPLEAPSQADVRDSIPLRRGFRLIKLDDDAAEDVPRLDLAADVPAERTAAPVDAIAAPDAPTDRER